MADQIYNADEFGLFSTGCYWIKKNRRIGKRLQKKHYYNGLQQCIRQVYTACNCNREIRKSPSTEECKSWVITGYIPSTPPHIVWMGNAIFKDWFFKFFCARCNKIFKGVQFAYQRCPANWECDNTSGRLFTGKLVSGYITVKFLAPNVTALLQPMDQGVIMNIKRVYRLQMLSQLTEDEGEHARFSNH